MRDQPGSDSATAVSRTFLVGPLEAGQRLDRFLAGQLPAVSRSRLQQIVDQGLALVNGAARKRSHRIAAGENISVTLPPLRAVELAPEAIPLDILYQDDAVAVINKPAGIIMHPGAGACRGTLAAALLHHFTELAASRSVRPGIVHRLDKDTSGVLVVARTDAAYRNLSASFRARKVEKTYIALLHGALGAASGRIELPVARDLRRRTRMTARRREGRPARTDWQARLRLPGFTLVEAELHTGRTHQLRVHFSALGHPIAGDSLYGAPARLHAGRQTLPPLGRNFLHAARIRFSHPVRNVGIEVRAPLPPELREFLIQLARACGVRQEAVDAAIRPYL